MILRTKNNILNEKIKNIRIVYRMRKFIKEIIISAILLVTLDAAFLYINQTMFENQIVNIQRVVMKIKPEGVVATYAILIAAINYFILYRSRPIEEAFLLGATINGVFEATNYSVFNKWPALSAVLDTIWGGVLFSTTTYITYALSSL